MSTSIHNTQAIELREGDRVLLKDLRILTVSSRPVLAEGTLTIKYENIATNERGVLEVAPSQKVRLICPGYCHIERDMEQIL